MSSRTFTVYETQERLRTAQAACGGRFVLSYDSRGDSFVTHWFKPEPHAFDDCRSVGYGTLEQCFEALDRYMLGMSSALMAAE